MGKRIAVTTAAAVLLLHVAVPAGATSDDLAELLQRAGAYLESFAESFRFIVAEELYRQWAPDGTGGEANTRTLRSDLVFVPLPGDIPWTMFRDVYEVDGRKVRDREVRLESLFLRPAVDAITKANAILGESARYNLGNGYRTVNVPTLALLFLLPRNQPRFAFERTGRRGFDRTDAQEIEFRETVTPTLVRDSSGNDVPTHGRAWIDPTRGTILRIEAEYDLTSASDRVAGVRQSAHVSTAFRRDETLDMQVPVEMKELYLWTEGRLEATARYSNFRRFSVETDETVTEVGPKAQAPKPRER